MAGRLAPNRTLPKSLVPGEQVATTEEFTLWQATLLSEAAEALVDEADTVTMVVTPSIAFMKYYLRYNAYQLLV
jgi:hypothetical protein